MAFYAEILIGFVIPLIMLMFEKVRLSRQGMYAATLMVLTGFAANRMNTSITGLERWPSHTYFPSFMEVLIMLGIAAIGFSAFAIIARHFPIFPEVEGGDDDVHPFSSLSAAEAE